MVTAFFDIGDFGKGSPTKIRTSKKYFIWAQTFKYLLNPLVVYTDSQIFYDHMLNLRGKNQSRTKLLIFNRTSSWAFRMKDAIKEIYDSKDYPKHFPNTVVPEYTCAMHAKYDVVSRAAINNYFNTKYLMWLDIGYFQKIVKSKNYFRLELPPNFNDSRIAVNQVHNVSMSQEPSVILKQKLDWIGGGLFLGRLFLILKFAEIYKRAVDHFLSQKLMNSDQQVLYAMYSQSGQSDIRPGIELQIYQNRQNPWFYLGYLMKKDVSSSIV